MVALEIERSIEDRTVEVQIYGQFLQRAAEPGALNTWTAFLGAGGTVEQLMAKITGSSEYFQAHNSNNAGFLARMPEAFIPGSTLYKTG